MSKRPLLFALCLLIVVFTVAVGGCATAAPEEAAPAVEESASATAAPTEPAAQEDEPAEEEVSILRVGASTVRTA